MKTVSRRKLSAIERAAALLYPPDDSSSWQLEQAAFIAGAKWQKARARMNKRQRNPDSPDPAITKRLWPE